MDDSSPDDWLPEGWRVEVRVRKNGRKDKLYFPPTGGAKFFSKLEVTRYLKRINSSNNGNNNSNAENKSSSTKNSSGNYNNSLHAVSNTSSKSVSVIDASNSLDAITPNSKNHNDMEESTQVADSEEKGENGTPRKSSKKVTFEKEKAEGLPPGWTKEVKLTKKGRKVRRDPYYTDPEGNYTFRSLRDALRYIQTGEPGKLAKIMRRGARDADDEDQTSASAKKQKLETNETGTRTEVSPASNVLPAMPAVEHEDKSSKASEVVVVVAPESKVVPDGETDPSLEVIEVTPEADEEHSTGKSKKKKKKKRNVQLPLRSSKRLARVEAVKQLSKTDATVVSPDSATSVLDTQLARKTVVKQSVETGTVNASTPEARKPASKSAPNENVTTEESGSKEPATGTTLDLPMGELWEDPCIAFAIKTLTGSLDDEPVDNMPPGSNNNRLVGSATPEKPKETAATTAITTPTMKPVNNTPQHQESPLNLSAEYTWADDPCIEFAIKTLTGAIPLDLDLFKQQDSRPNSSQVFFHKPTAVVTQQQSNSSGSSIPSTKKRVTRSQSKAM
ncbi:Methyl-CpG-binding domain-containing protein 13 [Linum grandiflorum]